MAKRIGIDLMGGDSTPQLIFDAALHAASKLPASHLVFFASREYITPTNANFSFVLSEQTITMQDPPLKAVRAKPNSSLVLGVKALKEKKIDAFISCGNTGAFIAATTLYLPLLDTIDRPALLTQFPSNKGSITVLDVGGNVQCHAKQLVQFAFLGTAYHKARHSSLKPKVALLNIGVESEKGTKELQQAYQLLKALKEAPFSFVGNVESRDVLTSDIDIVVTNGFTGNIFLKTAEGIASFIFQKIEERITTPELRQSIEELKKTLSYEASQGALLAGVDGIAIKCHGNSSSLAISNAILGASTLIDGKLIETMRQVLL